MRKIISSFFALTLLSSYANAKDGLFIGVDANHSNARHTISEEAVTSDYNESVAFTQNKTDKKTVGFSVNGGYRFSVTDKFFLAPEIFHDHLDNRAEDPAASDNVGTNAYAYKQDVMILKFRYGAKLNAGYYLTKKLNVFANAGLTNAKYSVQWNSNVTNLIGTNSYNSTKLAPIYGAGFSYDLTDNIFVKANYDQQIFNIRYGLDGWRSKVKLNVLKVGVGYIF